MAQILDSFTCLPLAAILLCSIIYLFKRHWHKKIISLINKSLTPLLADSPVLLKSQDVTDPAQLLATFSSELKAQNTKNRLFQHILSLIDQPLLLYDPIQKNIAWLNQPLLDLFKASGTPEDWQQKTPIELFRITSLLAYLDQISASADKAEPARLQVDYAACNIEICSEILTLDKPFETEPSKNTETTRFVLLKWHDITKDIKTNESSRDLIANVAHQLRTPLTSIKGYAETLLEGQSLSLADTKRFLSTILRNADRLSRLVNDVLLLARLEGAEHFDKNAPMKLAACIVSAIEVVSGEAAKKDISIKFVKTTEHEPTSLGNSQIFEQAVINLLDNAIKYSKKGDVVEVNLEVVGNEAVIKIKDNGPGIQSDVQSRIFERFYRVEGEKNKNVQGTGLGLAIVKEVAKTHGGRVWVESVTGKGAVFYLAVPILKGR